VGNLVQGNRLASAQGREVGGLVEEDNDTNKKVGLDRVFPSVRLFWNELFSNK